MQLSGKIQQDTATVNDRNSAISEALFLSIGEGAIVVDERGNISRVNKVALDILEYTPDELIGRWFPDTVVAEYEDGSVIPTIERPIMEAFLSGKPVFRRIYYRKSSGGRVPVALTVSPVMMNDAPLGAIGLFRDITEELQLEHAKDEFISIASHQLRTPATVVKQYLGMVLEGYVKGEEKQNELLRIAYEHNDNQLAIIDDLLKVAQAEANAVIAVREKTDIVKLLSGVVRSQKPDYDRRNIALDLIAEKPEVECEIDALHIKMVFENLINNANKYSPENSTVVVIVSDTAGEVIVKVQDTGIGISSQDMPKLFKKFSRAENIVSTASGTGLGLYWAKKLIELHKGTIEVISTVGKGTTFTVRIPKESYV